MRVLRKNGIERFRDWIENLSDYPSDPPPIKLLSDETYSHGIPATPTFVPKVFTSKYDLAKDVLTYVEEIEAQKVSHDCWPGIWDALALALFESICPREKSGAWKPNRIEHYIYDPGYTVRHRHRIYGPVTLYRTGLDDLKPFFEQQPSILGDFEEQVGSRNELAGNPTTLKVLNALYAGKKTKKTIPGYTNRRRFPGFKKQLPVPGTLRECPIIRFRRVFEP